MRDSRGSGDCDAEYDLCRTEGDLDLVLDLDLDLALGEREAFWAAEEARLAEGGVCDRLGDLPRDTDRDVAMICGGFGGVCRS